LTALQPGKHLRAYAGLVLHSLGVTFGGISLVRVVEGGLKPQI